MVLYGQIPALIFLLNMGIYLDRTLIQLVPVYSLFQFGSSGDIFCENLHDLNLAKFSNSCRFDFRLPYRTGTSTGTTCTTTGTSTSTSTSTIFTTVFQYICTI